MKFKLLLATLFISPLIQAGGGVVVDNGGGFAEMNAYYASQILPQTLRYCLGDDNPCHQTLAELETEQELLNSLQEKASVVVLHECGQTGSRSEKGVVVSACDLYEEQRPKSLSQIFHVVANAFTKAYLGADHSLNVLPLEYEKRTCLFQETFSFALLHVTSFKISDELVSFVGLEFEKVTIDLGPYIEKGNLHQLKFSNMRHIYENGTWVFYGKVAIGPSEQLFNIIIDVTNQSKINVSLEKL